MSGYVVIDPRRLTYHTDCAIIFIRLTVGVHRVPDTTSPVGVLIGAASDVAKLTGLDAWVTAGCKTVAVVTYTKRAIIVMGCKTDVGTINRLAVSSRFALREGVISI